MLSPLPTAWSLESRSCVLTNEPPFSLRTFLVAADTAATQIFASVARQYKMGDPYEINEITYLPLAEKAGVGTMDLSKLNMKRLTMA